MFPIDTEPPQKTYKIYKHIKTGVKVILIKILLPGNEMCDTWFYVCENKNGKNLLIPDMKFIESYQETKECIPATS